MSFLRRDAAGGLSEDYEHVADMCKKQLVKEKRLEEVARLSSLLNKLQKCVS